MAATVLGGVNQAVQQRNEGRIARTQGDAEGELFGLNAGLADSQAADALARGQQIEGRQRLAGRLLLSEQKAAFAGQGIDVSSGGSVQDVTAGDQSVNELDAMQIRNDAKRQAWGFQAEASIYRFQGDQARTAGRNRQRAYNAQAISTLLTTGADALDQYSKYRSSRSAPRIGSSSPAPSTPGGSGTNGGYGNGTASR
ncbi:MAG: hypothetical protein JWL97_2978 [Gemmatimonadales bacterium]|nr:hypothetical protein [Gemmatimonadales bacterium]